MRNISPPVFYYHSVAPKPFDGWLLKFLTIKLANFERQVAYLKNNHFKTIFMDEWLRIRRGQKTAAGKEVCLTFDDGLLDNWVYAYPVAKKYGLKFTIFVSPECIEPRSVVRPTLEDVWEGRCQESDLEGLGYLSWEELRLMQESGVVDIQSHTMTHAKYVCSPILNGFYYGGFKGYHPILNANPKLRTTYFRDKDFEKRLPLGTPLFEEKSSVVVKKHFINQEFIKKTRALAKNHDLENEAERPAYEKAVRALTDDFAREGTLLEGIEKDEDFRARLHYEIVDSKRVIEEKLGGKPVQFLCWPHGDNNSGTHAMAKEAGYLATTSGKMLREQSEKDRIPRIGADFDNGPWMSHQKLRFKVAAHYHRQPYFAISQLNDLKNKILQR
jgi:peptidoglycan/xylan/chitin deacetylase (PgdA/CDA1 family)